MAEIETITVLWPEKGPGTFKINASDFDPQRQKLASEDQSPSNRSPAQPKTASKKRATTKHK